MTDAPLAGRSNCILLGLPDDARTHFSFAHAAHRCHALRRPEPIDESFQEAFCLASRHVECPRYGVWASRGAAGVAGVVGAVGVAAVATGAAGAGPAAETDPGMELEPTSGAQATDEGSPVEEAGPPAEPASAEEPTPGPEQPAAGAPEEDSLWSAILAADTPPAEPAGSPPPEAPAEPTEPPVTAGARGGSLEPVPAAAPTLTRGRQDGPSASGAGGRGRSRLGGLARGLVVTVLLVVAGAAAGYGLAFVLTATAGSPDTASASQPAAVVSPSSAGVVTPEPSPPPPTRPPSRPPTATPSPTPGPTPTPVYRVHVVKAGETLSAIAAKYKTTVQAIVDLNKLANPNVIVPGQKLKIPPK